MSDGMEAGRIAALWVASIALIGVLLVIVTRWLDAEDDKDEVDDE